MGTRSAWVFAAAGCRGWHEPVPFDVCQPYALACDRCDLATELAAPDPPILRDWWCDDAALGRLEAVRRRSTAADADDTHFYDVTSGDRVAAVREHDVPVDLCGREVDAEWWGAVLTCVDACEVDPGLPDADPELPPCAPTED